MVTVLFLFLFLIVLCVSFMSSCLGIGVIYSTCPKKDWATGFTLVHESEGRDTTLVYVSL